MTSRGEQVQARARPPSRRRPPGAAAAAPDRHGAGGAVRADRRERAGIATSPAAGRGRAGAARAATARAMIAARAGSPTRAARSRGFCLRKCLGMRSTGASAPESPTRDLHPVAPIDRQQRRTWRARPASGPATWAAARPAAARRPTVALLFDASSDPLSAFRRSWRRPLI